MNGNINYWRFLFTRPVQESNTFFQTIKLFYEQYIIHRRCYPHRRMDDRVLLYECRRHHSYPSCYCSDRDPVTDHPGEKSSLIKIGYLDEAAINLFEPPFLRLGRLRHIET